MSATWVLLVFLTAGNSGGSFTVGNFYTLDSCEFAAKYVKKDFGINYMAHSCVQINK